jgi:superfamily II DNA or RNA helicase
MGQITPSVQFKHLRRSKDPEDYKLYRAGLQWDLIEPIVIEDRGDMRSETKWRELVEPYHHQVTNLITFCRRLPVTLLADDVGLGKTISAGLIISELISRNRISKILIVCPKLLMPQWREELDFKFGIPAIEAIGNELVKIKLPDEPCAVITTYNSARLRFDDIAKTGFDMLILDEAHKLRNLYGVDKPPQVAVRFRQALADRLFKYVLMLTATPIQNRLWDLYSLVDLLTVARGHENPFGNQGLFARKFIDDNRSQARHLKPEMKDEFRDIVYGYFPERIVQLHKVDPTPEELELIKVIAGPIQELNFLSQIIILQALISSPEALVTMLNGMARRETVPISFAADVRDAAKKIKTTAKLRGLATLVDKLRAEQPENWRMIVFTRWRETQTTIQAFLEEQGIKCGLINGDSGERNQETIKQLKANPPDIHVIVSTEAGSEGVNLQAANVLVNYDLPWNPMIVEQRIGRIQRLASEHASVCIFNIVLQGTFEEYIVGRLMEKLQMASHAIGDIEALLEATGLDEGDEDGSGGFEEKIRKLVVASLAGKDTEAATRSAEKSIVEAKSKLEQEETNINSLLGGMDPNLGPQCPKLPEPYRSMDHSTFVLAALTKLGAKITKQPAGLYLSVLDGKRELIRFDDAKEPGTSTLYAPGTPAFERLVSRITNLALHNITDTDVQPLKKSEEIANSWVSSFGATHTKSAVLEVGRCFEGTALMRVRATVAHDSYERLVEVECTPDDHVCVIRNGLELLNDPVDNPANVGVISENLNEKAMQDPGISEFCRFYTERMAQEIAAGGKDARKRKKLEDDFTPRIEISLAGLEGKVKRVLKLASSYKFEPEGQYTSNILVIPSTGQIVSAPEMAKCEQTGQEVPRECLDKCQITGKYVLKHLLIKSEVSGRSALPEHTVVCTLTKKKILEDEAEKSSVTGEIVTASLLKTSSLSGKKAEPQYFKTCEFTGVDLLDDELAVSQVSGKRYRVDEQLSSAVSGMTGHKQEYILCAITKQPLLPTEAEKCAVTGKMVMPGLLEKCEVSGLDVVPSELEKSVVSGKKALKKYFVFSSLTSVRLLEEEAIQSGKGNYCTPSESRPCIWSGRKCHPEDLRTCVMTGLPIHFEYMTSDKPYSLETLLYLLNGIDFNADDKQNWPAITDNASKHFGGKCKVEASEMSPDGKHLAVSVEVRKWAGLKVRQAGLVCNSLDGRIIGRAVIGKREGKDWIENA